MEAVGLADRRIEIDREGGIAGSRARLPGTAEELPADPVELADVAPCQAAQERAHRGCRLDPEPEHPARVARAQGVHVVDVVAARERRHHEGQHLVADVGPAHPLAEVEVLVDEGAEAEVMGERGRQDQARIGHQAVIVERGIDPVEAVG